MTPVGRTGRASRYACMAILGLALASPGLLAAQTLNVVDPGRGRSLQGDSAVPPSAPRPAQQGAGFSRSTNGRFDFSLIEPPPPAPPEPPIDDWEPPPPGGPPGSGGGNMIGTIEINGEARSFIFNMDGTPFEYPPGVPVAYSTLDQLLSEQGAVESVIAQYGREHFATQYGITGATLPPESPSPPPPPPATSPPPE